MRTHFLASGVHNREVPLHMYVCTYPHTLYVCVMLWSHTVCTYNYTHVSHCEIAWMGNIILICDTV